MNRHHSRLLSLAGLGLLLVSTLTPIHGQPLLFSWISAGAVAAQNVLPRPQVQLHLSASKRQVERDAQGQDQINWSPLSEMSAVVQPGDLLRYTLRSSNQGNRAASRLKVNQPIPAGMVFVLNSVNVQGSDAVAVTYSIDGGKTFVSQPTIQVPLANGKTETRPAPAELYTHLQLSFTQPLSPAATVNTSYDLRVR